MHLYAAPAYSIGKSKRSSSKKLAQPGPATYVNTRKSHSPSWKMTTARRNSFSTLQTPGPGSYIKQKEFAEMSKGVSFKGRPSSALSTYKRTPGPGDYQPHYDSIQKIQPSHKIPNDKRQSQKSLKRSGRLPGPATYNTENNENWKSGIKFGAEQKSFYAYNPVPGPCSYKYADQELKLKKSMPRFSFGSSQRIKDIRPSSPGPGAYDIPGQLESSVNKKKGYKIPASKKGELILGKKIGPGPGTYDITTPSNLKVSPAYTISGGPLYDTANYFSTPGPSSYNIPNMYSKLGVVIGKSKRDSQSNTNQPGPGSYGHETAFGSDGPKYTIHSKYNYSRQKSPGPGDYQVRTNDQHITSPIIKRQFQSGRMSATGCFESPGPGFYNSKEFDSISYSIGRQKREKEKEQRSPGPGQYNYRSSISNLPQYALFNSVKLRGKQY